MPALGILVPFLAIAFVVLMVGLQVVVRRRAGRLVGTPVPALPGPLGQRVTSAPHALLYFFSPTCGACRAITPRVRALAQGNPDVHAVDVTLDLPLARALGVMATPSTVELTLGTITGYHVGPIPPAVLARFRVA